MKKYLLILFSLLIFSACADAQSSVTAPGLITPASIRLDTALVERGDVLVLEQYGAHVRVKSEGLYFGETELPFLEYACINGQSVKAGDLLARLDTEQVTERIEDQELRISNLKREYEFENAFSTLNIDTALAEYVKMVREAGFDEAGIQAAEDKKNSIPVLELELEQQIERQNLTLRQEEEILQEMYDILPTAELRAPYDGIITLVVEKDPGDSVDAYDELIYISDGNEMFVELNSNSVSVPREAEAVAFFEGREYKLERVVMSRQETFFYSSQRVNPPIRFNFTEDATEYPPLGVYITVQVTASASENTLRVPINALYADDERNSFVYLAGENDEKIPASVEVGIDNDSYAEILSGLEEGDEIFVKP